MLLLECLHCTQAKVVVFEWVCWSRSRCVEDAKHHHVHSESMHHPTIPLTLVIVCPEPLSHGRLCTSTTPLKGDFRPERYHPCHLLPKVECHLPKREVAAEVARHSSSPNAC